VRVGCLGFFFMERNIAVVGLAYVGVPVAVACGLRGKGVGFAVDDSRRFTVFQL
jgi:UDP-N-acetyl-D-mannosaminuronate dehydrogenase